MESEILKLSRGRSSLSVHLFGATILSWKVDGHELLFVSKNAVFDNKKAIRGGIPFVFPQFGPWKLGPQHGFARISKWDIEEPPHEVSNKDARVVLKLEDNDRTRDMWNQRFRLLYTITLKEKELEMDVHIINTGSESFSFTLLLHSYFGVPDVTKCTVSGLQGCIYTDKARQESVCKEDRKLVTVNEFTDRVYTDTAKEHVLTNVNGNKSVRIRKEGLPDTVLWNPWIENAKAMSDFGDEEYMNMICVEAGHVGKPAVLDAGQSFSASQTFILV